MPGAHGYERLFAELKRRRVFRVMAVYGAVAFAVLQVADIAFPALGLPEWTITLILVLTLLGFPIAIVLAWAFETTPEGVKRTAKAGPDEITAILAAPAARRWPVGLAAAGGTALFLVGAWLALGRPMADGSRGRGTGSTAPADASIAVLPFANLSGDVATQPFVDGLHDDLLTQLSKIGDLTVISRTSVLEYRDTRKNIREIATELGVSSVLEGGVQRSGDQYRMNVQLIDASTDAHLWAEQYGGELTTANIFDVQTQIATAIADALAANLTAGERASLDRIPTQDLEAYELYRQAREKLGPSTELTYRASDRLIDRAIERDSSFAEAWAVKSIIASYLYWFFFDRSDSIVAVADDFSRRAVALAPGLAEGHWARGHYYYRTQLDYDRALEEVRLALQARPGDGDLEALAGAIARRKGDMRAALSHFEKAALLAPRGAEEIYTVGETRHLLRDYPAAERALLRAVEIRPDYFDPYQELAMLHIGASGDTAAGRRWLTEARDMGVSEPQMFGLFDLEMLERNPVAALAAVQRDWPAGVVENQFRYLPRTLAHGLALRLAGDGAAARSAFDSARVELEVLVAGDPTEPRYRSALGTALAGLGRFDEAIREGEEGLRLMPPEREAYRGAWRMMELARIYAMAGRPDAAIDRLEYLLSVPSDWSAWWLRLDPAWDPLREHPRFRALVATE